MANKYFTGVTDGIVQKDTNWNADALPSDGDVLIFDADTDAALGYQDGTAPTVSDGLTENGDFSITLAGGADLIASQIMDDWANQTVDAVTVGTGSVLDYDVVEAIAGNVALNASTMSVSANADIGGTVDLAAGSTFTFTSTGTITGAVTVNASEMYVTGATAALGSTVDLVDSIFNYSSTGAITGAVTIDATSGYVAAANHTVTGGITVTGGELLTYGFTVTSGVILAGGTVTMTTGGIVGAITDSAVGNTIDLGTAGTIDGVVDLGVCIWSGVGVLTCDTTGALNLGGAAVGLDIIVDDGAGTQTITAGTDISAKSLTVTQGTYIAAHTHTLADSQTIVVDGTCVLQLTDVGVDVDVNAAGEICTPGAATTCRSFTMTDGTWTGEANLMTFWGDFTYVAGTITCTGGFTFNGAGVTITDMPALTTNAIIIDSAGTVDVVGDISCLAFTLTAGTLDLGTANLTVAGNVVHTAGTIAGTGTLLINTTAALSWVAPTMPITLNGGATTVTAADAVSCSLFTMESVGGTYAGGAHDHTFSAGFSQTEGTVTASGTWTFTGTGPLALMTARVDLELVIDATGGTITVGDALSIEGLTITDCDAYIGGVHDHTIAGDCVHTAGTITSTGAWKITAAGNFSLRCATIPLEIDATGLTTTCVGEVDVKTFTLTDGDYAGGAFKHTIRGNWLQTAGTIASTGQWDIVGTSTVTLVVVDTTMTGAYLRIVSGTTTLAAAISVGGIRIEEGATLDGGSVDVDLAHGRITGHGTLTNCVPTGPPVHVAPGIVDGGGNDATLVVWDTWVSGPDL